jgi:hypothetical protein
VRIGLEKRHVTIDGYTRLYKNQSEAPCMETSIEISRRSGRILGKNHNKAKINIVLKALKSRMHMGQ